jgi:phosphate transport system substrate-binding protein
MAMRFGRCVNFGACTKADTKAKQPMPLGATDVVCAECGKPLVAVEKPRQSFPAVLIAAVVLVLAVAAFALSRFMEAERKSAPIAANSSVPVVVAGAAPARARSAPPIAASAAASSSVRRSPYAFALCGSNTIGSQLGPDLVRAFLVSTGAQNIDSTANADEQTFTSSLNGKPTDVHVAAHGSASSFTGLAAGTCQVGMASRRIKSGEAAALHRIGNMLSPGAEHVIGLDGIAVIVNAANPISSLSVRELDDIFTGKTMGWSALAGSPHRIHVLARDAKSGTFDTFTALVLDGAPLVGSARRFEDSARLSSAVAADPDAIGFIGLPYVAQAKALRISSGGNALAPNVLTIGRESYPLTRRLFLYTAPAAANSLVGKFVSFVQSDAGQAIVNKDGFVGTVTSLATSRSGSKSLPANAPPRYRDLVDRLDQANFNFYFNSGSDALDNKALVDVGRLVDIMSASANRSKKIVLVGFADSTGDRSTNQRLSENRATAAATELDAQGIAVKEKFGFGQDLPLRDNATEPGREKNRRVEIFLTR